MVKRLQHRACVSGKKPVGQGAPSLEELAARQGVSPVQDLDDLLGKGESLWRDDSEFEKFLGWLQQSRKAG